MPHVIGERMHRHRPRAGAINAAWTRGGAMDPVRRVLRGATVQAKLKVGAANDSYEQEADQVAERVMSMPDSSVAAMATPIGVQRTCAACEEEAVHRQPLEEEEEVQAKRAHGPTPEIGPELQSQISGLRGRGEPLPAAARSFFEPRFGADFGQVRIHTDRRSAALSDAINARAFTFGRDIVFGRTAYAPESSAGRLLMAHELTHVIQQERGDRRLSDGHYSRTKNPQIERKADNTAAVAARGERITVRRAAPSSGDLAADVDSAQTTLSPNAEALIPDYEQSGDTCGATSLVTALMIWDRQHRSPNSPSQATVRACDLVLAKLHERRMTTIEGIEKYQHRDGKEGYDELVAWVMDARDTAQTVGAEISEEQYQRIGIALWTMWLDQTNGLKPDEIRQIQKTLSLDSGSVQGVSKYDAIWNSTIVTNLQEGQIAQIDWYVRASGDIHGDFSIGEHVFLIGRLDSGEWFLSDQGTGPARFSANSRDELRRIVDQAAWANQYWIIPADLTIIKAKQVRLLASPDAGGVPGAQGAEALVPQGKFLGQVDVDIRWRGSNVHSGKFITSGGDRKAVESALTGPGGGLVIEAASGTFFLFSTSPVHDWNLNATALDKWGSENGLLLRHDFIHAWLILGDETGKRGNTINAY